MFIYSRPVISIEKEFLQSYNNFRLNAHLETWQVELRKCRIVQETETIYLQRNYKILDKNNI